MLRRTLVLGSLLLAGCAAQAHRIPEASLADITVLDRNTGERLPVYWHRGERWIAGAPGHRYAVELVNRTGERIMAVVAVDGINAVTGETAAWDQNGYVFAPGQRWEVRGWRKSNERVAAFEFTALPNSYAARTGRPDHVGVIGAALFRERPRPVRHADAAAVPRLGWLRPGSAALSRRAWRSWEQRRSRRRPRALPCA